MSKRDSAVAEAQATKGPQKMKWTGERTVKKVATKNALDACPEGKLNLSGPTQNGSSVATGLLRLVAAFRQATMITSMIRPSRMFTSTSYKLGLSNIQQKANQPTNHTTPWHEI